MSSAVDETSKRSTPVRWVVSGTVMLASLAVTASAWASAGPAGILAQAGPNVCPCPPPQPGFLTGTAGYAFRWLLVIAFFILTAVAAFALGRSRKQAEQA